MTQTDRIASNTNLAPTKALDAATIAQIAALAQRQRKANGVLMQAITFVGGQVEDGLKMLPAALRQQMNSVTRRALQRSYDLAAQSHQGRGALVGSDRTHRVIGTVSGAIGGFGGLPTALAELPVATTLIFRAVLHVAAQCGEDPLSEDTRRECLAVFGSGGPSSADDGVDTAFVGARLSLSGAAVHTLISRVAPKVAAVLSQKLAAQTVPVLGAFAGAGTNYAFVNYYTALAHVHFGLRQLARNHGEALVLDEFHRQLAQAALPQT
jgi:hypothetical protein